MFNPQLPENNPTWVQSSPPCERCADLTRERDVARIEADATEIKRLRGQVAKLAGALASLREDFKTACAYGGPFNPNSSKAYAESGMALANLSAAARENQEATDDK